MLHGLAGKPEILHTVPMLPAGSADLGGQTTEYVACDAIYNEERFASNPVERGEPPLTYPRFIRNLSSEPQFGNGDR